MIAAVGLIPLLAFAQNDAAEKRPHTSKEAASRTVEDGGTGPYKALMASDASLPTHTVFRPKDLGALRDKVKLPIVVWGNGACANSPWEHVNFLSEIASHGFLVIAIGPMPAPGQRSGIDAHFRTLTDQPNRGMAGLSMGGMQTKIITLKNLDKFSHIGLFSGGVINTNDVSNTAGFREKVKVVFASCGSRENPGNINANHAALNSIGLKNTAYVSPDTAHEFQTWRRSLHQFAPLLFRD